MGHIRAPSMAPLSKEFVQPEGYPDTPTINQRVGAAVARLAVRQSPIPMNPLVTEWRLEALVRVLFAKGILEQSDVDLVTYFTAYIQMQSLERLVDAAPAQNLLVATPQPPKGIVLS